MQQREHIPLLPDGEKWVDTATFAVTEALDECFIATASYGSKFEPAVILLRRFRDDYLLKNSPGQNFVKYYYCTSPSIANFIAQSESLKFMVKIFLTPIIALVYIIYNPFLTILIGAFIGFWIVRRRYLVS